MLSYIYQSLMFFRNIFSRHSTWLIFCMVILGFFGSGEMLGVASFCRFWSVGDIVYHAFLNFFRSTAWSVETLICYWAAFDLIWACRFIRRSYQYFERRAPDAVCGQSASALRNAKQAVLIGDNYNPHPATIKNPEEVKLENLVVTTESTKQRSDLDGYGPTGKEVVQIGSNGKEFRDSISKVGNG